MFLAALARMRVERKRNNTPLMIVHPISRRAAFGRTTEDFFLQGEEHETRQWEDIVLPPDDEPEPRRRRGSVDKVPRERSAIVALVILAICLVFGVVKGVSALGRTGNLVDRSAKEFRAIVPAASNNSNTPPRPEPKQPPRPSSKSGESLQVKPAATPAVPPSRSGTAPASPEPAAASATQPAAPRQVPPEKTRPTSEAAPTANDSTAHARKTESNKVSEPALRRRPHESDNFVWSPTINAIVPVSSITGLDQEPATVPSAAVGGSEQGNWAEPEHRSRQ